MSKLSLDRDKIDYAKNLAELAIAPIYHQVERHSSVSVERAILRLLGVEGSSQRNPDLPAVGGQYPLVNDFIQFLGREKLKKGAAYWIGLATLQNPRLSVPDLVSKIMAGEIPLEASRDLSDEKLNQICERLMSGPLEKLRRAAEQRDKRPSWARGGKNLRYAVVGTGNIQVDIAQAKQLVAMGVDIIALRRSSAQSLLDYIPEGETGQGSAGTLVTQDNLRLLRLALDDLEKKLKRRIGLACSASGLCFPEIALIAALEGVDYLWSDPFHGILFRDINIKRNFIDQAFARRLCAFAGVKLQSGEEEAPYTPQLLAESWYQILTKQFLLQAFSKRMGIEESRLVFGHYINLNGQEEDKIILEWARTQLMRELFPLSRLKLMYLKKSPSSEADQLSQGLSSEYLQSLLSMAGLLVGDTLESLGSYDRSQLNPSFPSYALRLKLAEAFGSVFKSFKKRFLFQSHGRSSRIARQALDEVIALLKKIKFRAWSKRLRTVPFLIFAVPRVREEAPKASFIKPRTIIRRPLNFIV
jgi:beta-lysine 5,6-aminomutase alpha subunit